MKITKSVLILLVFSNLAFGQPLIDTIYFNSEWEETSQDSASFFRLMYPDSSGVVKCEDYWISGEIQMTGYLNPKDYKTKEGQYIYYYKNGNKQSLVEYINGEIHGEKTLFYENETVKKTGRYKNNTPTGFVTEYDENGNIKLNYIHNYKELDNAQKFEVEFKRHLKFLNKNIIYPEEARKSAIEGRVFIECYVAENGKIIETRLGKGSNKLLDDEALRVAKLYEKWPTPIYKGEETVVLLILPFTFKLY
jgi:TonB family protein